MKREILCTECGEEAKKQFPDSVPYPGEHVKFVDGKSIVSCVCDHCMKSLQLGDHIIAMSIWADYGGGPYYSWEGEYLIVI